MQKFHRRFPPVNSTQQPSVLRRHQMRNDRIYTVQGIKIIHEFDDYGNHRILVDKRASEWADYRSLTSLRMGMGHIGATTDYYSGVLPRVFLYIDT